MLVLIPAVLPARFSSINSAKLWIKFGSAFSIQPGEFAKIALLVFFAYYLVRKREVLSLASSGSSASTSRAAATSARCSWSGRCP